MLIYLIRLFKTLSRLEKSLLCLFGVTAIVAGVITGWNSFAKYTTLQPARGGEYTEGIIGQPTSINPLLIAATSADKDLVTLLFADLLTLTERYEASTTGKVWLVTLKDDLVWSDGKALTADDVLFTINTIQHPDTGSQLFDSWQGVTIERVSQLQMRFTLKAPYGYFPEALRGLRIAPAHIFEGVPVSNIRLSSYNLEPVTSGPYNFVSYEKRRDGFITSYNLAVNNDYAGSRALIEKFTVAFFPTYQDGLIAFNRKQIDGLGGLTTEQIDQLRISHTLYESALPQYYALFFNPATTPVLKNKVVRQALTKATDRETLIAAIFNGHADSSVGPFSQKAAEYASEIYKESYFSLKEAEELLTKQGWRRGADGVLARGSGKTAERLALTITVPDISFLETTAEQIKTEWERLGVRVNINTVSADRIESEVITPRNYEILLFGNMLGVGGDLFSFWHSSQRFEPGLNFSIYQNTKVDKLIETIRAATSTEMRAQPLIDLQRMVYDDAPAVFLYSPRYLYGAPTSLGGFNRAIIASVEGRLANVNEWYLKTERVFSKKADILP